MLIGRLECGDGGSGSGVAGGMLEVVGEDGTVAGDDLSDA